MEKRRIAVAPAQIAFSDAEAAQVFGRQIDAAAFGILADVAQDVGQLKRHAAFLGQRQGARRIEAEDVDDGQPHHRRHLVAVAVQLVESLQAARLQIR